MNTPREYIAEESITDAMLEQIPVCKRCKTRLSEGEVYPKRLKALNGYLCRECEAKQYGSSLY